MLKRTFKANSFRESISILFKGPGWQPGSPRLGYPELIPAVNIKFIGLKKEHFVSYIL